MPAKKEPLTLEEIRALDTDGLDDALHEALSVLDHKKRKFVELQATGVSYAEAMRQAGYSDCGQGKNSTQLRKGKDVSAAMSLLTERTLRSARINKDWCVRRLAQNIEDAARTEDWNAVNTAIRELNRMGGYYEDTSTVQVDVYATVRQEIWTAVIAQVQGSVSPPRLRDGFKPREALKDDV